GYELSPLLWKKVQYGLSAGRVQSVAVRLIVEREREIEAFTPEEYWSLTAHLAGAVGGAFTAELKKRGDKNLKIVSGEQMKEVLIDLDGAGYMVAKIEKKEVKRNPA